jgi:6-pyruvoyltetrahydropterin/6-carboxytetrahydropterin synthase
MHSHGHEVHFRKESFKFSVAHMTVFSDGTKESLHGHNYATDVSLGLNSINLEKMIAFSVFKNAIKEICEEWDEKVLLPQACPFFEIKGQSDHEIEFVICQKRYVLPKDEVVLLPIDNISSERLSQEFGRRLLIRFQKFIEQGTVTHLSVRIEESPGQGGTYFWQTKVASL